MDDSQLELEACNDDFNPDHVSTIESFGFFCDEEYGLQQPVATSARSWSAVKAVFRGGSDR